MTILNRHALLVASRRCVERTTKAALQCNYTTMSNAKSRTVVATSSSALSTTTCATATATATATTNPYKCKYHCQTSTCTNKSKSTNNSIRSMSGFSFAGPRSLNEIMKTDLLEGKTKAEISEIWMTYHEGKERVHGAILKGCDGVKILERAEKLQFFIQPIFRNDGFFMLLSQFQPPSHFLLAYLEDYKMDPNRAQPLVTFSIFNDLVESHDMSLVRCDVINKGIEESEGQKVMDLLLDSYKVDEDFSRWVKQFNEQPGDFDVDDYISCMNQKWKE